MSEIAPAGGTITSLVLLRQVPTYVNKVGKSTLEKKH